ncbi:bifunctional 4-hydroxy-3-methylbut-2-enyl diphosphate reductase/30S ribosomal protein S1 (plasmid) [Pusillibacter faecalis]|uniref:4-hydroxy-3-methylbut-2-enyl diphosphate reductase n=1 Tax=Pusillibacter faecalis TaxID=2714358 RepID=A0A830QSN1_9FIRM|nr:bifunctional 4-hydroxy-3-methylbut-2-enyl diphosphate reductase/30S ribosomal protein S1 [Pusillibacter faecalis]BCK85780.1 bifunctional 4-hydroxy-3-methylbut-2-enyl diphosphate reductase/30S ribosomal protein S1 [Pusillibacter faecalis]
MREVMLAKSAGFCYGVRRAVELARRTAEGGGNCWMLGDLIHNRFVVEDLARRGIRKTADSALLGPDDTVIIRSHGELKSVLDALEQRGVRCVNATCPNVIRIQRLVAQAEAEGRQPVIIGEAAHPEVAGIASWCLSPLVFDGPESVQAWLDTPESKREIPMTVVAQTTCIRELFESSWKIIKKECTNVKIFDTICDATHKRQSEAAEIASQVDVMVVVGDRKSANTKHLTEICMQSCSRVLQIEAADELSADDFNGCSVAGLTAGASTPAGIIKEVYATMSEEIRAAEGKEESFEELLNQSFKTLNNGDRVTGIVTAITPTEVQVDVGAKQAAYIKLSELTDDPTVKPEDVVHVGDEIETWVVRVNDVEGYAELSKKRLDAAKVWENIEQAVEEKTVLDGTVTEENKGGIVVSVKGVRVFVPASQSGQPRGADLSAMKGQKVQLRITEVNRARRRVVGSIRSVTDEARRAAQEEIWSNIEVGKHYTGTVKSMTSYGVFVDIGGVDGMVHISELSWSRIKTPSEVCKVGDTMEVYVISFDPEKRKISLGVKDHSVDPWQVFMDRYSVGDVANVRIVKLMTFGAFAEVVPGVDGLIHISQIADRRIEKPEDVLSEGQMVDAKITAIDEEKKKISLSIRALLTPAAEEVPAEEEASAEE